MDYDNVSWNNNNVEHAIKSIAYLRREIGVVSMERGIEDYLALLSVRETCKVQGLNFLDFLCSREIDLDIFKDTISKLQSTSKQPQTALEPEF